MPPKAARRRLESRHTCQIRQGCTAGTKSAEAVDDTKGILNDSGAVGRRSRARPPTSRRRAGRLRLGVAAVGISAVAAPEAAEHLVVDQLRHRRPLTADDALR